MFRRNQVLRTLSAPESRDRLEAVVADPRFAARGAMAREVCKIFKFVNARGRLQISTCVTALTNLADRGWIDLPAPTNKYAAGAGPHLLPTAVPMPDNLPDAVRDGQDMAIHLVIAWCLMVLTLLGWTVPDLDLEVFFTE
ncbi:MAG: hypothetical protein OXI38_04410 [Bacteroidota bacterium]|nr:hypothetical protein [Bacteroidota bacterium]